MCRRTPPRLGGLLHCGLSTRERDVWRSLCASPTVAGVARKTASRPLGKKRSRDSAGDAALSSAPVLLGHASERPASHSKASSADPSTCVTARHPELSRSKMQGGAGADPHGQCRSLLLGVTSSADRTSALQARRSWPRRNETHCATRGEYRTCQRPFPPPHLAVPPCQTTDHTRARVGTAR